MCEDSTSIHPVLKVLIISNTGLQVWASLQLLTVSFSPSFARFWVDRIQNKSNVRKLKIGIQEGAKFRNLYWHLSCTPKWYYSKPLEICSYFAVEQLQTLSLSLCCLFLVKFEWVPLLYTVSWYLMDAYWLKWVDLWVCNLICSMILI